MPENTQARIVYLRPPGLGLPVSDFGRSLARYHIAMHPESPHCCDPQ